MNIILKGMAVYLLVISGPLVASASSSSLPIDTKVSVACTLISYRYLAEFTQKVNKPLMLLPHGSNDSANKATIGAHISSLLGRKDLPVTVILNRTSCPLSCKITNPGDYDACTIGAIDTIYDIKKTDLGS